MVSDLNTKVAICGVGHYLPEKIITNDDLSKRVDTSDEWIFSRAGIRQRHFAADNELTSDLATQAAKKALINAGLSAKDIDLIVLATATPDRTFPATAVQVQANLGMQRGYAYDVAGVCSGYILALQCAHNAIKNGDARTVLVIGAETFSRILDMSDRNTCVLFGDGAAAIVLRADTDKNESGIIDISLQSDGSLTHILNTTGGPSLNNAESFVFMNGREVYRQAVKLLTESAENMLLKHGFSGRDVRWFIPHQANIRIINHVVEKLGLAEDRVITTVDCHANTSAASIPLALSHAAEDGRLQKGDLILHEAIGGGLIWGSALLRW